MNTTEYKPLYDEDIESGSEQETCSTICREYMCTFDCILCVVVVTVPIFLLTLLAIAYVIVKT